MDSEPNVLREEAGLTALHRTPNNSDASLCQSSSELRRCVKVEVDILDSLSLTVLIVSVDIKQR